MAKRREFQVVTDFLTRHEMVRAETPSMRGALREAAERAKRTSGQVYVIERGARGQAYVARCERRPVFKDGKVVKQIAKCFLWGKHKKALKAAHRATRRRRKKYGV